MANHGEPKDYMLGRKAYKAYFDGVAIEFTDLSHDYQMRWVNVARAVVGEGRRLTPKRRVETLANGSNHTISQLSDEDLLKSVPRTNSGRIDYAKINKELSGRVRKASIRASKRRYELGQRTAKAT